MACDVHRASSLSQKESSEVCLEGKPVLIESLESRRMLSASASQIAADYATANSDYFRLLSDGNANAALYEGECLSTSSPDCNPSQCTSAVTSCLNDLP